jgi:ATP-dependent helicase HrpB
MKRLAVRGGQPDADIAALLASAFADRIAHRRGQEGATSWPTGWGRCSTPTMRWAATNG